MKRTASNLSLLERVNRLEKNVDEGTNLSRVVVVEPRWVASIVPSLEKRFLKFVSAIKNGESIYSGTIEELIKDLEILENHSYSEDDTPW